MSIFDTLKSKLLGQDSKTLQRFVIDDAAISEAIEAEDVYSIIEPVWLSVNIYDSKRQYDETLQPFCTSQAMAHAMEWYTAEVNNGGHHQFYSNSTGIVWENALAGYQFFDLPDLAEILEASLRLMGGTPSFDREERWANLDETNPDFDSLDDAFYAISPKHEPNLLKYIDQNRSDFHFDGEVAIDE